MIKNILFLILISAIYGCEEINRTENLLYKVEELKAENDSLKKIVAEVNTKYVFDSISFRDKHSAENTYKLNSDFELELLIVAYSKNQNYFIKYDSIGKNMERHNPDTLKQKNGGFKYKMKLTDSINPIYIDMNMENKYGKSKKGLLHDKIKIKN
ncbi:hypothetical protein [Aquimarina sp. 2201CG5-10]|uniref:hypothetical protein n=1 Tax=Aquimarina callyspongiae TaxID=3098150 RepID=UPI002AB53E65|nr:hypothetical protein [Aquimarina sp. 2201CG5-10]MDY8135456.1 hypothetical protein [Aquimarina sp. 2201CG5-10]